MSRPCRAPGRPPPAAASLGLMIGARAQLSAAYWRTRHVDRADIADIARGYRVFEQFEQFAPPAPAGRGLRAVAHSAGAPADRRLKPARLGSPRANHLARPAGCQSRATRVTLHLRKGLSFLFLAAFCYESTSKACAHVARQFLIQVSLVSRCRRRKAPVRTRPAVQAEKS